MTEEEWLACADPWPMLEFLQGKASERKLRLFACACYRRSPQYVFDFDSGEAGKHNLKVVEVAERHADGMASEQERHDYFLTTDDVHLMDKDVIWSASDAVLAAAMGATELPGMQPDEKERQERTLLSNLLRDIFGNPYRPVTLAPSWQTPQVVALAQAAYDQREMPSGTLDPVRLAVLADALEEAGCTDAEVLGHLHGPGPHVRGCWALDLLLGKE